MTSCCRYTKKDLDIDEDGPASVPAIAPKGLRLKTTRGRQAPRTSQEPPRRLQGHLEDQGSAGGSFIGTIMPEATTKQYIVWIIGTIVAMSIAGVLWLLGIAEFEPTWQAILRVIDSVFN